MNLIDRLTDDELRDLVKAGAASAPPDTQWVHTKSGVPYRTMAIALRKEDCAILVVYLSRKGIYWTRPLTEFLNSFERKKG